MFYDKNSNGIPDIGEDFGFGGNPSFSSSIATVNEKRVGFQTSSDITPLLADNFEDRVVNSNNIYYYTVIPSSGWTRTSIALQNYGQNPGPCTLNGPYYICAYNILGETPILDLAPNQQITVYLGVNSLQISTTTTTISATSTTTTTPGQTTVCIDSDSGFDYYTKGNVTEMIFSDNVLQDSETIEDACVTSTLLAENICNSNQHGVINFNCPDGCLNGACINGTCSSNTCNDTIKNGGETGIDCGGSCAQQCSNGELCVDNNDCASGFCQYGMCAQPEVCVGTDLNCGSICSQKCTVGQNCLSDFDCTPGLFCDENGQCNTELTGTALCSEGNICAQGCPAPGDPDCAGTITSCEEDNVCNAANCDEDPDCNAEILACFGAALCTCGSGDRCVEGCTTLDMDCVAGTCGQGDGCGGGLCNPPDPDCTAQSSADGLCLFNSIDDVDCVFTSTLLEQPSLDTDGDGIPDVDEIRLGLDPNDPGDALEDPDGEGLINLDEYHAGTDLFDEDTDDDGWTDKEEVDAGTDPLNPDSHPSSWWITFVVIILVLGVLGTGGFYGYTYYEERKRKEGKIEALMRKEGREGRIPKVVEAEKKIEKPAEKPKEERIEKLKGMLKKEKHVEEEPGEPGWLPLKELAPGKKKEMPEEEAELHSAAFERLKQLKHGKLKPEQQKELHEKITSLIEAKKGLTKKDRTTIFETLSQLKKGNIGKEEQPKMFDKLKALSEMKKGEPPKTEENPFEKLRKMRKK